MNEDFFLITIREFKELFKFFCKVLFEVKKRINKKIDDVGKLINEIKSIVSL